MAVPARVIPNEDIAPPPVGARKQRTENDRGARVPPHDLAAEASLLGACLLSAKGIAAAVGVGIDPQDFYKPAHGHVWMACVALYSRDEPADPVTVADELHRDGLLEHIGGPATLIELQAGCPAISNAAKYAGIVKDHARMRRLIGVAAEIADLGYSLPEDVSVVEARAAQLVEQTRTTTDTRTRLVDGAAFLLDQPDQITAVWGHNDTVLWAEGEATMIVGPPGVGKTTIAQQVVLGRIGARTHVLGQPVAEGQRRVLYLAMDRPRQAARSMRRMVAEHDRELLEDLLVFWKGPPPFNVVEDPRALARYAKDQGADTVVIDSLKDACHKLNDDEHASKTNAAIQEVIASGIELVVLHHQRKAPPGTKKAGPPKSLDEVYGNVWLTAGMGSVILVWGDAGDPIVELSHLKPPSEPVGPWTLTMDFDQGLTTIHDEVDVLAVVRGAPRGVTANLVARLMFKVDEPDRNQIAKATRKLQRLRVDGLVHVDEQPTETGAGKPAKLYFPIDTRRTP